MRLRLIINKVNETLAEVTIARRLSFLLCVHWVRRALTSLKVRLISAYCVSNQRAKTLHACESDK